MAQKYWPWLVVRHLGINAAHGTSQTNYEQWMSKAFWPPSTPFFIEHNKGHHLKVATPDDPARTQKPLFFFIRSIHSWFLPGKLKNQDYRNNNFILVKQ
jgi:hypothetical protein